MKFLQSIQYIYDYHYFSFGFCFSYHTLRWDTKGVCGFSIGSVYILNPAVAKSRDELQERMGGGFWSLPIVPLQLRYILG